MKAAGVLPSFSIRGSNGSTSLLITYSRTKLADMITAPGGWPALIAARVFKLVSS
jgi:hypothetical protein